MVSHYIFNLVNFPRWVIRSEFAGSAAPRSRTKPNRSKSFLMFSMLGLPGSSFRSDVNCCWKRILIDGFMILAERIMAHSV